MEGGPPCFGPGFTCPALLGHRHARGRGIRVRGCCPLRPAFPCRSASRALCDRASPCKKGVSRPHNPRAATPCRLHAPGFGLFRFRSPLLAESRLISFPPGTEMFHFPGFASCNLFVQLRMTGHDSGRVAPFRNSRLTGCLAPPRDLSQPTTSFIAFWRQGIHLLPFLTCSLRTSFPTLFNFQRAHP